MSLGEVAPRRSGSRSELFDKNPGSYIPKRFDNPLNPQIHRMTTVLEIWRDTDGEVGMVAARVGISSGAAVVAALRQAALPENLGIKIVVMLASSTERYLSIGGFAAHG
jgi:cysteine synthase A